EGLSAERILSQTSADAENELPGGMGLGNHLDDLHAGASAGLHPLVSHLFRDATIGLISADHKHLYVLEDVATLTRGQGDSPWNGDAEPQDPFHANWQSNRLTAYVLETGRRAWSVGGGEGRDPQNILTGGFFLGAPVAEGDDLFVVAALGEEIRLLALDPATGLLKWSQLLAYADTKIDLDIARRWVSTPIAVGQGIIVCPTTVGWLVAVDRVRRSVLWAYRYLPEEEGERQEPGEEGTALLTPRELNDQWLAAPPVVSGAHVIFTPSDGDVIVCVDLTQGRLVWQEDRDDGLSLAGVTDEHAIIIGQTAVISRRLSDGKVAWSHEWDEARAPTGRSAIVGDQLYVPMTDGTLRLIALATGEETQKLSVWPGQPALGSLVKAGRRLFAYGPHGLQMFDEQPGVLAEIQERKATHPDDATALIREAELWLLTPRYADAARQLLALNVDGLSDEWAQRRHVVLWQALVGLVQTVPDQADSALHNLARLASTPDEKLSVELFRIDRQIQQGHLADAFDAYWHLAEQDDGPAMIVRPHLPQLQVRRRAWLQGRLQELWQSAEGEVRQQLDDRVRTQITAALDHPWERAIHMIEWCDFHPAAAQLHWKFAEEWAEVRDFARAEQQLLPWTTHAAAEIAHETEWRLALLYRKFGLTEDALVLERRLRQLKAPLTLSTGQTLTEALAQRPADAATVAEPVAPAWDQTVLVTQLVGTQYSPPVQEIPSPVSSPYLSQLLIQVESNEQRLTFADRRTGAWRWLAPLRGSPRAEDYGDVPAAILGHSVVVLHKGVLQRLSPVDQKLMWSRTLENHHDDSGMYHTAQRLVPQSLQTASADEGDHEALFETAADGHLTAVWPSYICLQGRRTLTVYDPITGRERWTRSGVSPHALIFPTRDYICVMEMADDHATLYRASDGQPVEAAMLEPRLRRTLRWEGNDLIQLEAQAGLRLFNLGNQRTVVRRTELLTGRDVWRQDFAPRTEIGPLDDDWLIAVDPAPAVKTSKRGVTLIRCADGERRTLAPLALNVTDAEFFPIADAECVYLVANHGDGNSYHYGDSLTTLPVNGTVCCWDRATGELLWTRDVADQNLVMERFAPSPVLLFLTRNWKQRGNSSFTLLNLLAIEKRSGKILHESSTPSTFGGFHSLMLREHEAMIELASYNQKLRLIPQRPAPAPPAPPKE
ncbi:MAG TPA: PQQ-binding-like beta-propeller repeat protein, partial [Planctomycetaceae bacterium]|nr:PQQ-binding-like beta-propeller repeat protein [Planctomycetaceae bacterium]